MRLFLFLCFLHTAHAQVLEPRMIHLGVENKPEWAEFSGRKPAGPELEIKFTSAANPTDQSLFLRQVNVKRNWEVNLNGKRLGFLVTVETPLIHGLAVPANTLKDGENTLLIRRPQANDDIEAGEIRLEPQPLRDALRGAQLQVTVLDEATKVPIPCRLTLVRSSDETLMPLLAEPAEDVAARPGVVYLRAGQATISVPPGDYTLFANRGLEWSLATEKIHVAKGDSRTIQLTLKREVPTENWIAVDSHIHNLTFSGHGDATLDERMITIAGEGIELAVATDHNVHVDYTPAQERLRLTGAFRGVTGNEVTTSQGHFNAFPIAPNSPVVDAKVLDWSQLIPAMRQTPGVQVVTLNHPRDLHSGFIPLGPTLFDPVVGKHRRFLDIDALELITSGAMQTDIMLLYRDWFALLNRGHRISGVASSDSHDVSRFILGQGRTYVSVPDADLSKLDLDRVWKSYQEGRLLVSLGLLANVKVDNRFGVGDLATGLQNTIQVTATVHGPSWVNADRVEVYANGVKIRDEAIESLPDSVEKLQRTWEFLRPKHDVHLVVVATGPGVTRPFWDIPRPYQPSALEWTPRVIGSTNPVWIDGDGDGAYRSAADYARELVTKHGSALDQLFLSLAEMDEAVAIQAADYLAAAGAKPEDWAPHLAKAPEPVRKGFAAAFPK